MSKKEPPSGRYNSKVSFKPIDSELEQDNK